MENKIKKSSEKSTSSDKKPNTNKEIKKPSGSKKLVPIGLPNIAEQIGFWTSQKNTLNNPFVLNVPIEKDLFGKPKRFYSNITKKTSGNSFQIEKIENKFPIKEIFYVGSNIPHTVELPGLQSQTFNSGIIHINAEDLVLTRMDSTGKKITATIKQEASFNTTTGEIKFKLGETNSKFLYISQYRVKNLFSPSAYIELNPYTTEPTRIFKAVKRTKTVFSKLDGETVNIYSYLNSNPNISSKKLVTFDSPLEQLQKKLEETSNYISNLEKRAVLSQEEKKQIGQFKYVSRVLTNEQTLAEYKLKLSTWYENYKSWTNRPELIAETIESHQYFLEFKEYGQAKLTNYMSKLIDRTKKYDESRITFRTNTENIVDRTKEEFAEREKRNDEERVAKLENSLNKAKSRQNEKEIVKLTGELADAKRKAEVSVEDRMMVSKQFKIAEGYGLYPPYLISDILRYGSSFIKKSNVIDSLALSSENIGTFAKYLNGFKSLVFNIVSVYNHLATHKLINSHLCANTISETAELVVRIGYSSGIYKKLLWLADQKNSDGSKAIYNIENDIEQLLRFLPCKNTSDAFNILANNPADMSKVVDLFLLDVDEPLYGQDSADLNDFDLLYANEFKQSGIIETIGTFFSNSLSSNFIEFLDHKFGYNEDIEPTEPLETIELDKNISLDVKIAEPVETTPLNLLSEENITKAKNFWAKLSKEKLVEPASLEVQNAEKRRKQQEQEKQLLQEFETIKKIKEKQAKKQKEILDEIEDANGEQFIPSQSFTKQSENIIFKPIPIKYITREGVVRVEDGYEHNFVSGDVISFDIEDGDNTRQFSGERYNIRVIDNDNSKIEFKLVGFLNQGNNIVIRKGTVTKIHPDLIANESFKDKIKATRDSRDELIESPTQYAKRRERIATDKVVKQLNFKSIKEFTDKEEAVPIDGLSILIQNKLKQNIKSFEDAEREIKEIIIRLKNSDETNFNKLTINELTDLVNKRQTNIPNYKIEQLRNREEKEFEVGKKMFRYKLAWLQELEKQVPGISVKDLLGKNPGKKPGKSGKRKLYEEKYLKYKAKYLALKTQLGL